MNPLFNIQQLSPEDWSHLAPVLILSVSGLISLLLATFHNKGIDKLNFGIFSAGCIAAITFLVMTNSPGGYSISNGIFYFDQFSTIFSVLIIGLACTVSVFELSKMKDDFIGGEFFSLLSFALVGMIGLISTHDFMMLFICLELMSLATYVLIAIRRRSKESAESSLKYFILGGVMAAVFLMGMSFIFGATGSFNLLEIKAAIGHSKNSQHMVLLLGILLIYAAMLFKVGAFPFHTWLPDVYSGASNTITAFMITAVKVTAFALIVRVSTILWVPQLFGPETKMYKLLFLATLMSLAFGAFVGLRQSNLKRILAYSSIAHTGFILMALISLDGDESSFAMSAITSYLFYYAITSFGAFAFLHLIKNDELKSYDLENLNGLYRRSPVAAVCLTVFLLSMAGVPPTAGFFGKYYVILAAIKHDEMLLAFAGILSSLTAAYFYIKPISNMFFKESTSIIDELYVEKLSVKILMVTAACLVLTIPYFYNVL